MDLRIYRVLNDHWERTYGDVGWQAPSATLQLPWYFLGQHVDGVEAWGVRTGGAAFCSWQLADEQRRLIIDTTSGGVGVQLGARELEAAEIVHSSGGHVDDVFGVLREFARKMCPGPRPLAAPVYGINDWYFAYGKNSDALIRQHTELMAPFAEGLLNRPFSVIDAGWFNGPANAPDDCCFGRDMQTPNSRFRDMGALAADIRKIGMRPGIWTRPLCGDASTPTVLRLPRIAGRQDPARPILDPTIPENLERVAQYFALYRRWNFDLVKIDFTTFDILGKWGFEMLRDRELTPRGWRLHDVSRTNGEIIRDLYATMRRAAGDTVLIGCNTISHLSAGVFEINRIGDDTSGKEWDRTRKMGVNTLAFRGAHHGAFYAADADCVGLTNLVPWEKNRQWLELVAKSGTPLFISAQPDAVGAEQKAAIRESLVRASQAQPLTRPVDWLTDAWPRKWEFGDEVRTFEW
jgi:alpha-galactosidase